MATKLALAGAVATVAASGILLAPAFVPAVGRVPAAATPQSPSLRQASSGSANADERHSPQTAVAILCGLAVAGRAVARASTAARGRGQRGRGLAAVEVASAPTTTSTEVVDAYRAESKLMIDEVQAYFVEKLEALSWDGQTCKGMFLPSSWLRDEGTHGGGKRFGVVDVPLFNRASVNASAVHYDDMPSYPAVSGTALSVIIHPRNPRAPSMHCHFSYTQVRSGKAYWRMISDLNPSLNDPHAKNRFDVALRAECPPQLYDDAKLFGDKYFFIPELNRYRGTSHLFIAELMDKDMSRDAQMKLARTLAKTTIDTYTAIVQEALDSYPATKVQDFEREQQLDYHTVYFYQVLFLDRGTTAGLMAHTENDVGTLASLPNDINASLLASWMARVQAPHDELLRRILAVLPASSGTCHVSDETRQALATTVRNYYLEDKSRTEHQADMDLEWWALREDASI